MVSVFDIDRDVEDRTAIVHFLINCPHDGAVEVTVFIDWSHGREASWV